MDTVLRLVVAFAGGIFLGAAIWAVADLQIHGRRFSEPLLCDACGRPIDRLARLPLWGLGTRRRCPHCHSVQGPWRTRWELAVALFCTWLAWQWGATSTLFDALVYSVPLLLILLVDLRARFLFLNNVYLAVLVGLFMGLFDGPNQAANAMVGMGIGLAVGLLFFILSRWIFRSLQLPVASIGIGDAYVAAAVGALVRADDIVRALFLAVVLTTVAIVLLPLAFPAARRQALPFGPFLCLGALLSLCY